MKREFCKTMSYVLTAAMILGIAIPASPVAAKKKAVKLSTKKINIKVGKKKTIKVKNTKKKAKWSIKSGKKNIKLSKKKKKSVVVKGKKAGKAVVVAKIGKKKLFCKVTVKKKATVTNKPKVTPTPPVAKTIPTLTPTASPSSSPAPSQPTAPDEEKGEAVKDVVIDMTKVGETSFSANGKINFSNQLESRFDLTLFKEMKVSYVLEFEGEDTSHLTGGKIALANSLETLNGTDDGIAFTYNMMPGTTSVKIPLSGNNVFGKPVGINIQPMDSAASYGWPEGLKKVTITGIEFVAKAGAVYPKPGTATPTPKPTTAPEFESSEFKYEGLDEKWIEQNIDPTKPVVAMTFDDGPGGYSKFEDHGMQIQKALKAANAHATFFYIGAHIEHDADSRKEVEEAYKAGFEVANHSYDSSGLNGVSAETVKEKIAKTDALLSEITGYSNFLFRAPNVAYSQTMFAVIEKPFIDVSIWSQDYQSSVDKDAIVENVTKGLKDGGIINMHSVHQKTAEAVPEILQYCADNDFQVVSVSELFAIKGKKLMTGVKYFNCSN